MLQLRKQAATFGESVGGGIHFRLLDGMTVPFGQSDAAEVNGDGVGSGVGWTFAFDHLVHGNIGFSVLQRSQRQTTLLQLALGIVPLLVENETLESREEADVTKDFAVFQVLVDIEGAEEGLQHVGALFRLHVKFAFTIVGVNDVLFHAQVIEHLSLRPIVD